MNMGEWMQQNPRPDRPHFDMQALLAARGADGGIRGYLDDWHSQMGDWRNQMHDWRMDRRDFRQQNGPQMSGQPIPGGPNTQFPLNPGAGGPIQGQQVPGSSYGFNLGQVLQQFPNGLQGYGNGLPGPNPGY